MTKDEAWQIIEFCREWNKSQVSPSLAFDGKRAPEDDIYDARRSALAEAWRTVGGSGRDSRTAV